MVLACETWSCHDHLCYISLKSHHAGQSQHIFTTSYVRSLSFDLSASNYAFAHLTCSCRDHWSNNFQFPPCRTKLWPDMILVTGKQTDAFMNRVNTICPFANLWQDHNYLEPVSLLNGPAAISAFEGFEHVGIDQTSICLAFNMDLLYCVIIHKKICILQSLYTLTYILLMGWTVRGHRIYITD